jgi:hypothetical protein
VRIGFSYGPFGSFAGLSRSGAWLERGGQFGNNLFAQRDEVGAQQECHLCIAQLVADGLLSLFFRWLGIVVLL